MGIEVEVRLPTVLRQHAGGLATVKANGETIGAIFEDLLRQFPLLKGQLLDDDVRYLEKLDTAVGADDVISILPAVAGG